MTLQKDVATHESEFFQKQVRKVAVELRRLADDVERNATVRANPRDRMPDHAEAARDVIHKVMWGLANLQVDGLVSDARSADIAIRAFHCLEK